VKSDNLPAIALADLRTEPMKKFMFTDVWSVENILKFESDFLEGSLKPYLKSEKPSNNDDKGNVKVIVGETFEEKVLKNDKDVLLEFYAPWCGHCKTLAPKYEQLGAKFADVDQIVIAKIDATANEVDHPKLSVRGFPTIVFFPGNDKSNPITYSGEREVDGFIKFLSENAHNSFNVNGVKGGKSHEEL